MLARRLVTLAPALLVLGLGGDPTTALVWSQVAPQVRGHDNLVGVQGPVIFTANHSSHLDAPLILCSLPPAWRRRWPCRA